MELVVKHLGPVLIQPLCVIIAAKKQIQIRQSFCLLKHQFGLSVISLILCHGGVCTAMVLQVKFAHPLRCPSKLFTVIVKLLSQLFQMRHNKAHFCSRHTGKSFFQTSVMFQMFLGRAAATIAIAEGRYYTITVFLLLETIPGTFVHGTVDISLISGTILRLLSPHSILCGNIAGKNLRTVNTLPHKFVHRHFVGLVPADLGGYKIFNTTLFQNLGHSRTVTEHVR